jgi:NADPH-dependent 2,4-dienoyl-CoA reductase/sulfur reductase-like enzyme
MADMQDVPDTETKNLDKGLVTPQGVEAARSAVPTALPHVVIVGAGFGGLRAATALRDVPVHVTVIDRNNHHLFQPSTRWRLRRCLRPISVPLFAMS